MVLSSRVAVSKPCVASLGGSGFQHTHKKPAAGPARRLSNPVRSLGSKQGEQEQGRFCRPAARAAASLRPPGRCFMPAARRRRSLTRQIKPKLNCLPPPLLLQACRPARAVALRSSRRSRRHLRGVTGPMRSGISGSVACRQTWRPTCQAPVGGKHRKHLHFTAGLPYPALHGQLPAAASGSPDCAEGCQPEAACLLPCCHLHCSSQEPCKRPAEGLLSVAH